MSQLRGRFRQIDSTSCTVLRDEKRVRSQMSDCGRVAGVHDEAIGVQYARVCTLYPYAFTARCWISDAWVSVSALPTLYLL
jgi:hypothetical protein